ncbi:hypothetical protein [Pelagicoccus albus]|uniref:SIR2-like domain-containing protein n=1 Tax=Pelagicoccus albus TaxID=415222 RepID=A0A7X1EAA2_9BACT|nr:hypothetical protein [Pelagicoccus albus]MBC2606577.1 hypothetical protein [Pelagicoccus albus]
MSDNVFIFGAGVSVGAGIPLLSGFVEKMWRYAATGVSEKGQISDGIMSNLKAAIDVRSELDGYHGRVSFNDRNIEHILSLLSFNMLVEEKAGSDKLEIFIRAICDTIELSCRVEHSGFLNEEVDRAVTMYDSFWKYYIGWVNRTGGVPPVIISFNYDLVLERSLIGSVVGPYKGIRAAEFFGKNKFSGVEVDYFYGSNSECRYKTVEAYWTDRNRHRNDGVILEKGGQGDWEKQLLKIEYYKLHGSLNFNRSEGGGVDDMLQVSAEPYLLPPVFSKQHNEQSEEMWRRSLEALRRAKNIYIVGYSLPDTDIYMKYYLKAALGPNRDLNRVYVFDPLLFDKPEKGAKLRERYLSCFSPQMYDLIDFRPASRNGMKLDVDDLPADPGHGLGTFSHFVGLLGGERFLFE